MTKRQRAQLNQTERYIKRTLRSDRTGHDWWHTSRVVGMARYISQKEKKGDLFEITLAALLHDVADWKFSGDEYAGTKAAQVWLTKIGCDRQTIDDVTGIIANLSYKGGTNKGLQESIEGKIVQDADRLDALGAIGIARTFAYGGWKGRVLHNPGVRPHQSKNFSEYKKYRSTSINHFYEKLLRLSASMYTETARTIAKERHAYLETFLKTFYREWNLPEPD